MCTIPLVMNEVMIEVFWHVCGDSMLVINKVSSNPCWFQGELTHQGWDKMAAIFQTTVPSAFSWMKMYEFIVSFHWSLSPRAQLTIFQHWFREWLGAGQATSHYLNQWWFIHWRIYASLGLNELIHWGNATEQFFYDKSILVQVMTWCRQASSHYLS